MQPRSVGDYRERVRRETFRGRFTLFIENIEGYLVRHTRANNVYRLGVHWLVVFLVAKNCI